VVLVLSRSEQSGAVLTVGAGSGPVRGAKVPTQRPSRTSDCSGEHRTAPGPRVREFDFPGSRDQRPVTSERRRRCGRLRRARGGRPAVLPRGRPDDPAGVGGGLSSIGRASECGSEGYGFETRRPPQFLQPPPVRGSQSRLAIRDAACKARPPVRFHRRGDDVCAEGLTSDNDGRGLPLGAMGFWPEGRSGQCRLVRCGRFAR
jgi:hypothetical protein